MTAWVLIVFMAGIGPESPPALYPITVSDIASEDECLALAQRLELSAIRGKNANCFPYKKQK